MIVPRKSISRKVVANIAVLGLALAGVAVGAGVATAADRVDTGGVQEVDLVKPIDPLATPETVALFQNMYYMAGNKWMTAKQDDMVTGYTGSQGDAQRATGVPANTATNEGPTASHTDMSNSKGQYGKHGAVQGMDLGYLELKGEFSQFGPMDAASLDGRPARYPAGGRGPFYGYDGRNIDGARWNDMVMFAVESYQHGSINTWSWHETNPVTYGGYSSNVYRDGMWVGHPGTAGDMVLPGGELNARYQARLDSIVEFNEDVTAANGGTPVPVLWRPYHEHSGDWFWWGIDDMERKFQPLTYENFSDLWKYMQSYLMDHGVHNFIYEISPDRSRLGEPSYFYQDLMMPGGAALFVLMNAYIDARTWSAAIKATAKADLLEFFTEVNTPGFGPTSFHWNEPFALNNQGVPLDLDPVTGARTTARTEFDSWWTTIEANGQSKWKNFFMHKWEQGFPGADYVDLYGIDNYWESGGLGGHSYHPYNGQAPKLLEMFCSTFDYVAEKARADQKLVAMTEGSSSTNEIYQRFVNECTGTITGLTGTNTITEGKYPNLKYVSYALTWRGGTSTAVACTNVANPACGPWSDYFVMAGDIAFYEEPIYFKQTGDIDVDLDIPEYLGGLGLEFSSNTMNLGTVALSTDKAFWEGAGTLPPIAIEDTRAADPSLGWDATITAGDWVIGPGNIEGKAFGIAPEVLSVAYGQTVTAGAPVEAWFEGFVAPGTELASSPAGGSRGVAEVGGDVSFKAPSLAPAGAYMGVFSVTLL